MTCVDVTRPAVLLFCQPIPTRHNSRTTNNSVPFALWWIIFYYWVIKGFCSVFLILTQPVFTYSKSTMETSEHCVNFFFDFEHNWHNVLILSLSNLNKKMQTVKYVGIPKFGTRKILSDSIPMNLNNPPFPSLMKQFGSFEGLFSVTKILLSRN